MQFVIATFVFLSMAGYHSSPDGLESDESDYRSEYLKVVENLATLDVSSPEFAAKCVYLGDGNEFAKTNSKINDVLEYMSTTSDESNALLHIATDKHVKICVDDITSNERGFFDHEQNLIVLGDGLNFPEKVLILVHEFRHLDQFSRGFCPTVKFDISEFVRLTFALEADAQAITTLSAWVMKENGFATPWNTLNTFENYKDIAEIFSSNYMENGDLPIATNAAFAQWYHSDWRFDSYYASACTSYFEELERTKLIQTYGKLPDSFFDTLCTLPDGTNYGCQNNPEINIAGPSTE